MNEFKNGIKDSIPIALGYLAVSFSLGIAMLAGGIHVFQGALMSLTNVTSAGEFAGVKIIIAGGTIAEMVLTQFIINIRVTFSKAFRKSEMVAKTDYRLCKYR